MSNLQPPDYEPQLSDVRTRANSSRSSPSPVSALGRRNATRLSRRQQDLHRSWDTNRVRRVRLPPPTFTAHLQTGPASKRRRTERRGQFEMEQLPMELRYCDGGRYDGGRYCTEVFSPEYALRDDSSVYCTKNSRCNMILRHVDGHCFSLQRLVIRAPTTGYTSPNSVRAGMIFVTMDDTDLLSKTNYTVHYKREDDDEEEDENSDEERDFQLLDADPRDTGQDEEDGSAGGVATFHPGLSRSGSDLSRLPPSISSSMGAPASSSSSPLWANLNEHLSWPQPPVELLEPNATFSHKEGRTKCVINFEPAISGRYILAKFFSTHANKNIDIEFCGAYGFVGRRFFPSITLR